MIKVSDDPKQQAILVAAWQAFATYGFRKTSMDDIARGAGMSRPALYLHYRNKEALFAGLVDGHYGLSLDTVAPALANKGTLSDWVSAAFDGEAAAGRTDMKSWPAGRGLVGQR